MKKNEYEYEYKYEYDHESYVYKTKMKPNMVSEGAQQSMAKTAWERNKSIKALVCSASIILAGLATITMAG